MEVEELSGDGAKHLQWFEWHRKALPPPLIVALFELKEGPLVMGNVENIDPDTVTMDMLMGEKVKVGHKTVEGN